MSIGDEHRQNNRWLPEWSEYLNIYQQSEEYSSSQVFVIHDTELCPIFENISTTNNQNRKFRFYASASISVDEIRVGTLTIIDYKPRMDFNEMNCLSLRYIAETLSILIKEKQCAEKCLTEMRHNICTPLMSIGIASSLLSTEKNELISCIQNSNLKTKDKLLKNFQYAFNELLSSVSELNNSVEANFNMKKVIQNESYEAAATLCNLYNTIQSVKEKLITSGIDSSRLEWLVDHIIPIGMHISYPNVISIVLYLSIKTIQFEYNKIKINITFYEKKGKKRDSFTNTVSNLNNALFGDIQICIIGLDRTEFISDESVIPAIEKILLGVGGTVVSNGSPDEIIKNDSNESPPALISTSTSGPVGISDEKESNNGSKDEDQEPLPVPSPSPVPAQIKENSSHSHQIKRLIFEIPFAFTPSSPSTTKATTARSSSKSDHIKNDTKSHSFVDTGFYDPLIIQSNDSRSSHHERYCMI